LYASEIASSRLIANPGCYATSVILALRPLAEAGLIAGGSSVVCDCKSGASGAGKDPRRDLHFVEVDENFKAYNLFPIATRRKFSNTPACPKIASSSPRISSRWLAGFFPPST